MDFHFFYYYYIELLLISTFFLGRHTIADKQTNSNEQLYNGGV